MSLFLISRDSLVGAIVTVMSTPARNSLPVRPVNQAVFTPTQPVAKGRLRIGCAAVALHACIGSVYAGSVLVLPLQDRFGWSRPDITLAFSVAIAFLGLSAAASGATITRRGARWATLWSLFFVVSGYVGSACAIYLGSKEGLYLFYGVVMGTGLGLGYIAPLGVLFKAFPLQRGMASGLAVTGFGVGPMVFSPVMVWLFASLGLVAGFMLLALLYATVMGAAAWAFGTTPDTPQTPPNACAAPALLRSRYFWCLWWMLCLNVSCGIALLSVAAPLLQELGGVTGSTAATLVGVAGLFNAAGRIFWANLSDVVGRQGIWVGLFFLGLLSFSAMAQVSHSLWFPTFFMLAVACFGGGFACMPPYVADLFGPERVAHVYGWMLTAMSTAGFVGPGLMAYVQHATGSYYWSLPVFVGLLAIGCLISMLLGRQLRGRASPRGLSA